MVSLRRLVVYFLLCLIAAVPPAAAQESEPIEGVEIAPVVVDGVALFAVRGTSAIPPDTRAERIRDNILAAARDPAFEPVSVGLRQVEDGFDIWAGERVLRGVYDADARIEGLDTPVLAETVRERIEQAITDYRAARSAAGVQHALRVAGLETLFLLIALGAIALLWRLVSRLIHRHVDGRMTVWQEKARDVVQLQAIWAGIRRGLRIAFILAGVVATAIYANSVLLTLPWTRDAGRRLAGVLVDPLLNLWNDFLAAVPGLIVLAVIIALTVFAIRIVDRFFAAVGARRLKIGSFEPEWARPTARLARVGVMLLGLVMAYPYIPGSSSEAFKAISIFAGVLISLGASSIVANALAGNSLIYRRAFRVGDRVEIAGVLGDVEGLSAQATFLRTPKNERVTLPNSLVLGSQVVNYSQLAAERGLILHTEVGIGYEVPWREVEAMLLEAARRTPGLLETPAPFVLQKRLGDYAPVYEINGYTREAGAAPRTLSALIANVQDAFAERGVQIMTPSYVADPAEAKVPPFATDLRVAAGPSGPPASPA